MKLVFFGDSICVGQFISPHLTWVSQISSCLEKLIVEKNENIWCSNVSISGNTTRMALERMPFDVQSHGIDIIYIQFGMNDCNYWQTDKGVQRVTPNAFEANLKEMIVRAKIFGAKKILIGTNHLTPKTNLLGFVSISYQESNIRYNKIIRKVSEEEKLILVDNEVFWKKKLESNSLKLDDLLLSDQIHLSLSGHQLYFEFVYPLIKKAVEELL